MTQWFEQKFSGSGMRHPVHHKKIASNLSYTTILIWTNVVAFILASILGYTPFRACGETVCKFIALQPEFILGGQYLWTFVTSMFMHVNLTHLFVNMLSLMFIGNFVEKLIGRKRFIGLYLWGGLFAGLFFVLVTLASSGNLGIYAVGASGAIFALGGLLAVLTPRLPVLVFFIIPMPMWAAMGFLMFGLWIISSGFGLPIGNVAHLGGLIVGIGYGFYLKKKYPRKTEMIGKYFSR